jgi:rfaE bifunctional protein nucleotidyltransferase chain/domain
MSMVEPSEITSVTGRLLASAQALSRATTCATQILSAAEQIARTLRRNGKVIAIGNGGSAMQAQHLAAECVGRYSTDRGGLRAIALSADSAAVTAIGNDYGFDLVFARQIEALGDAVDTLVAFSTSGRSPNVVRALAAARQLGLTTILLTGPDPDPTEASTVDVVIPVPAGSTALVQECHLAIGHLLMELVELRLFGLAMPPAVPKVTTIADLLGLREVWRRAALTVVWTNGCFDLPHVGHVRSLTEAKAHGDILVVGLNTDESVRRLKGNGRPVYRLADRQEILAGMSAVDHVVPMAEDDPRADLELLRPDIHFKGGDYRDPASLVEKPTTDRIGVRTVLGRHWSEHGTTGTIDAIVGRQRPRWSPPAAGR